MTYFKDKHGFLHRVVPGSYESKHGTQDISSIEITIKPHLKKVYEEVEIKSPRTEEILLGGITSEVVTMVGEVYDSGEVQVVPMKKVDVQFIAKNRWTKAYVNQPVNAIDHLFNCPNCKSHFWGEGSCKCTNVGMSETTGEVTIWV